MITREGLEAKKQILSYLAGDNSLFDSYRVGVLVFNFETNLLSYFGTNPIETNIREYKEIAIKFLDKAFPTCLEARNARNSIKLDQIFESIVRESEEVVHTLK